MGRLYWKFFAFIWLAQVTALGAMGGMLALRDGSAPPAPPDANLFLLVPPMGAAMVASLIFAALLAGYFSRPIRNLRDAFDTAASGNLNIVLGAAMGRRRDELADLGRHFDRMTSRLRSLLDGQRRLLHDVSHELRSPLARLQAATGLIRQQPADLERYLQRIEAETARIDDLVGELLTLSRLETGETGRVREDVDVGELVGSIVEDTGFEAGLGGGNVKLVQSSNALVNGDSELLHRAIENVLRNAVKHGSKGDEVVVEVTTSDKDHTARIRVLDRGPGVPEQDLETIFQPFFRSGSARTEGHGLGLAIARRVIAAHAGSIRASNRAGGGLCVEVSLPLAGH